MSIARSELDWLDERKPIVGEVVTVASEVVVDRKGHEYTRRDVVVGDESDADPELRDMYVNTGQHYERLLRINKDIPGTQVTPKTFEHPAIVNVPEENEAARWLYYDDGEPTQMVEWAQEFPNAIALEPLQQLDKGGSWLSAGQLDERTLKLFTNMVDGIGLRSRARIYSNQLVEYVERTKAHSLDIVSLGSGAAVPNIQATRALEAKGIAAHWQFYDFNSDALLFAQKLAEENDFQYSTFDYGPIWENPATGRVEPRGRNYVRSFREVKDESVDIVDALGLWEYLDAATAKRFANELYRKLKPGGSLIVSNMLPSRPQFEFNKRAVGWPGLHYRTDTDLLDIIDEAGIDTRNVSMTHDQKDRDVYVVMEVRKP